MKTVIVYWTGTGNTEGLAKLIAGALPSAEVLRVDGADAKSVAAYDVILLGCPAMGAETLEETEFEPFYRELEPLLAGKTVGLFGSYDWGDGEWMRLWESGAKAAGVNVAAALAVQCAETGTAECIEFAKKFA
jgi:flavodoxin short chain